MGWGNVLGNCSHPQVVVWSLPMLKCRHGYVGSVACFWGDTVDYLSHYNLILSLKLSVSGSMTYSSHHRNTVTTSILPNFKFPMQGNDCLHHFCGHSTGLEFCVLISMLIITHFWRYCSRPRGNWGILRMSCLQSEMTWKPQVAELCTSTHLWMT